MKNETELLEASLAGNKQAFGRIVHRYQTLVCSITYCGTGDFGKSEELAQEVFVNAWKGLKQLKELSKFRAWLCTIARNTVRKWAKHRGRDVMTDAQPLTDAQAIESAEAGPAEKLISKEQEEIVWNALQDIPAKYREPMVLFYRQQQSVKEVAADLGISENTAKQQLSRGRHMLKEQIAAIVEKTLKKTTPGAFFATAVIAVLPAVTVEAASALAAGTAAKTAPAAKAAFTAGLSGAILGPVLGMMGGIFGAWMSIKSTKSPRERQFVIKLTVIVFAEVIFLLLVIGVFLVLALKGVVPKKVYWTVFAVIMSTHFIGLFPIIIWGNRRIRQIQKEDGTYVEPKRYPAKMSKANIYGAFGGSIFGAVCWIIPMSFIARDRLVLGMVLFAAGMIFWISTEMCLRDQKKKWRILIADGIALCALDLLVVNFRWNQWMEVYRQSSYYEPREDISLWAINLIIGIIFAILLILFLVSDLRHRRKNRQ